MSDFQNPEADASDEGISFLLKMKQANQDMPAVRKFVEKPKKPRLARSPKGKIAKPRGFTLYDEDVDCLMRICRKFEDASGKRLNASLTLRAVLALFDESEHSNEDVASLIHELNGLDRRRAS